MKTLSKKQQDILLDYYFECAGWEESEAAKQLLLTHSGARQFYDKLSHSLSALDHLDHQNETCPDHLVEVTLEKLYSHQPLKTEPIIKLGQLLTSEREKIVTKRPSFWRTLSEAVSVAAAIVVFSGLFVPVTRQMRAQAWQTACQANLNNISRGFTQYAGDNNGSLPAVETRAGNPWWKVGSTQPQNHSNTRHVWLLVKRNYVSNPKVFVCPGTCNSRNLPTLDSQQIQSLPDFPDRRYITYSFKLITDTNKSLVPSSSTLLMSDANPIFESCVTLPKNVSRAEFDPVKLNEKLLRANSSSHRGRGQNLMFSNGTIKFTSQRVLNENDDIFTVKGRDTYQGTETPAGDQDVFLVP
ncbi:MAG: hypothetical protein A2Y12_03860 [Planctomycetes bacterium GWF2_42_9]|nr:MAG: hypothetical protein A2Y12_03860 [Planctomycetes bacterium GWF2_42_9]HAL45700.1 hypothetical protein [Phycisphaerales bacterium]